MSIPPPQADRSIADIIDQLIDQVTRLIRSEGVLARQEVSDKASTVLSNVSILVVGVALLLPGLVILLEAAVAALMKGGMPESWASLLVGGGVIIAGIICVCVGINRLKSLSLIPQKTIQQVQRDVAAIQEVGKHS